MTPKKKISEVEMNALLNVKKTFSRELAIRRQRPFEFMKEKGITNEYNNLATMLDASKGFSILTLARIADAFGYDIELKKREEEL